MFFFFFIIIFNICFKNAHLSNANSVDFDRFAASDLGLRCLLMPHLWDTEHNELKQHLRCMARSPSCIASLKETFAENWTESKVLRG